MTLTPASPAGPPPARRDHVVLPGTADRIQRGVPTNTRRAYRRAWTAFTTWCTATGRTALPATPHALADYVAHLCDLDYAPATIEQAIAVISKHHKLAGHPGVPDTQMARLVLRDHRRSVARAGRRVKEAPPITRDRLRQMTAACDPHTLAGRRDRLLLVLGWALAGRRSELAALDQADVRAVDDGLEVLIRVSKTDKDAHGEVVFIPAGQHPDTDPVRLLHAWLAALRERGVTTGPLLRGVTRHDTLYRHGRITPDGVNQAVRRAARRAGLPDAGTYSAHSLRAGFATQAADDQVPVGIWSRHGRWSPVPHRYVRAADQRHDNALRRMNL